MLKVAKHSIMAISLACVAFSISACATTESGQYHVDRPNLNKKEKLVRIALLAPFNSQNNSIRAEAEALRAAAELAVMEKGDKTTVIVPVDSGDTPDTASVAARNALQNGADFILGPLFSSGVQAVAPYARSNNTLLFSFSTDTTEAGKGVFVISFLPEDEARRIVNYAAKNGVKKMVLLVPQSKYGERVTDAALKAAARGNIQILGIEKYDNSQNATINANAAAKRAAILTKGGNRDETAILLPERGSLLRSIVQTLSVNGASTSRVRYLGTGIWNDDATLQDSRMLGGWFVAPDSSKRDAFEERMKTIKGKQATRIAGMGYDATAIIASLSHNGDKSAITARSLENTDGFDGVDGRFRFSDGVIERGMSVMEVSPKGSKVIEAPQTKF